MALSKIRISLVSLALVLAVLWLMGDPTSANPSYVGRERDAAWRQAAEKRIQRFRKGDLRVSVLDQDGEPVTGAKVDIRMLKHAFRFGTAASQDKLLDKGPEGEKYRDTILTHFNSVTLARFYDFVWSDDERAQNATENLPEVISWLQKNDLRIHGHVLVWNFGSGGRRLAEPLDRDTSQERVKNHFQKTIAKPEYHRAISSWDVLNEPSENSEIYDSMGAEGAVDWFREAHRLAPQANLVLNETRLCSSTSRKEWPEVLRKTEDLVTYLQEHKAPLHSLGIQSHQMEELTPIPRVVQTLDRLSRLNLELMVTEFDIKLTPNSGAASKLLRRLGRESSSPNQAELEQLEADYLRDYLTACFSQPAVKGFTMWGFWDGDHWHKNAPLFRTDWSPKKAQDVWLKLTRKTWWSELVENTNPEGLVQSRVFLGDYKIVVSAKGRSSVHNVQVLDSSKPAELVVTLK